MTPYLIKSAISLAVLLALYHLALEREKMHRFNRFYLLFSLLFSLLLPFLIIPIYVEMDAQLIPDTLETVTVGSSNPQAGQTDYFHLILWVAYGIVAVLLLLRFAMNIYALAAKIRFNEKLDLGNGKLVLLSERVLPHTFLNYIFVSRDEYENNLIEKELYTHELAHVRQRHTIDILLIELIKVIFWFNPLFYLYARAIRLNHEFLADEQVINTNPDAACYQNLLLQKASGVTCALASSLNFSLTKKRLLMMTKTTNRAKAVMLKAAVMPVMTLLVSTMCPQEIYAQKIKSLKDIPADNIRGMYVNKNISQKQIDSLKKADPVTYKDATASTYYQMKIKYVDATGKDATMNIFESNPNQAKMKPEIYGESKIIDPNMIKRIDYLNVTRKELDSLRKKEPTLFGKGDLVYQKRVTTYADENGKIQTQSEYIIPKADQQTSSEVIPVNGIQVGGALAAMDEEPVYRTEFLKQLPEYKDGGMAGFYNFINKNFKLPKTKDGTYKIIVNFIVEPDGTLSKINAIKAPDDELGREAVRVINQTSGSWKPGEADGKPIRTSYNIPITITIKN